MLSLTTLGLLAAVGAQSGQDTTVADSVVLREIVVTATRAAGTARVEDPAALSLIEPSMADRGRGALAVDLLRDVPGVYVQQTSAGQGAVVLRGLVGNQVLLLVDGVPLNNGTYRDGPGQYLATIDPETIRRIEIIRGPASVLYGSDAQGGVVNVITRPHEFAGVRSVRVSGSASSANAGMRGRASAGLVGNTWTFGVGGTLATTGDLQAGDGLGPQTPTGFDAGGLDARFQIHSGERHTFTAVAQHFTMDGVPRYDRYVDFRSPAPGRDAEHLFDPQTRQLLYARYRFAPGTDAVQQVEATASLSAQREGRSRIRLLDSGLPDDTRTRWRDDVHTPGFTIVGTSMVHAFHRVVSLTWGGDFYHDDLNTWGEDEDLETGTSVPIVRETATGTVPSGRFPDGATANRTGVFVSAESIVLPHLKISAGLRWSRFRNEADVGTDFGGPVTNTSSDVTGQLGMVVTPAPAWHLAFRLAEGFRAPNLYDLTNVGPVPGGVALPNVTARPERSMSYELGVRYSERDAAADVTLYYTRIRDFIDRAPGSFRGQTTFEGEPVFIGQNVGTATVKGFEASGVLRTGVFAWRTSLLYTRGDQEGADGRDEPMAKIPPFAGTTGVKWETAFRNLWVEYTFRWAFEQDRLGSRDLQDPRIPDGGTPGYAVHGLRASVTVSPRINVTAGFENLTDELYRDHASGVDNAGRHVWVGLSAVGVL